MNTNKCLTIGICDDNKFILEQVYTCIKEKQYLFQTGQFKVKLLFYDSPHKLIRAFDDVNFNLIILDIEMPYMSGFEVARILQSQYPEVYLAFISSHDSYVFDSYDFEVLRFIRKTHLEKDLSKTLRKFFQKIAPAFLQLKLTGGHGLRKMVSLTRQYCSI